MQANQNKKYACYFSSAGEWLAISWKAGLIEVMERQMPSLQIYLLLLLCPTFIVKHDVIFCGISVLPSGSAVLAIFPPRFLCTCSSSLTRPHENWEVFVSVQVLIYNKVGTYQLQIEKLILYHPKLGHIYICYVLPIFAFNM